MNESQRYWITTVQATLEVIRAILLKWTWGLCLQASFIPSFPSQIIHLANEKPEGAFGLVESILFVASRFLEMWYIPQFGC